MLFTEEGRGCLGGVVAIAFGLVVITAIGAAVLFAIFFAIDTLF